MQRSYATIVSPERVARLQRLSISALAHAVLLVAAFLSLVPFVWMFLGSFKTFVDLTAGKGLLPKVWTLENYERVVNQASFLQGAANSVLTSTIITASVLLTSCGAGYVFAKYNFRGKDQLFMLLLITMMVPFAVVVVPLYVTVTHMGLSNTLQGLVITGLYSTFGIFMMRQFMESIPNELIDAGRIDGASEWWIWARLIIPLAASPLAALTIFTFLGNWDSFFWPYILLTSHNVWTLPLVMAGLKMMFSTDYPAWCAASMFTVTPVMLLYLVMRRQFVRGIAMTGLKL